MHRRLLACTKPLLKTKHEPKQISLAGGVRYIFDQKPKLSLSFRK